MKAVTESVSWQRRPLPGSRRACLRLSSATAQSDGDGSWSLLRSEMPAGMGDSRPSLTRRPSRVVGSNMTDTAL
jgi:hypothetical protein